MQNSIAYLENNVRVIKDGAFKLYSTCNRAEKFGNCRDAAPIFDANGIQKWVALPFWSKGSPILYYTEAAFSKMIGERNAN